MKIFGDYHTHTTYSHGKGSIFQNAITARARNLRQLGIADHGFGHILYGMDRSKIPEIKRQIKLAEKETGVKIYFGVEANFTSLKGDIDLTDADIKNLDIILVGHHRFVRSTLKNKLLFFLPNLLFSKFPYKKLIQRNTETIIKALDKYPIDILTHLNYQMPIDVIAVAKKAVETNTYIEINNKKMCFTNEQIQEMIKLGVQFIISSDAHIPANVGNTQNALEVVRKYNIPESQVANLNKLPKFKRTEK